MNFQGDYRKTHIFGVCTPHPSNSCVGTQCAACMTMKTSGHKQQSPLQKLGSRAITDSQGSSRATTPQFEGNARQLQQDRSGSPRPPNAMLAAAATSFQEQQEARNEQLNKLVGTLAQVTERLGNLDSSTGAALQRLEQRTLEVDAKLDSTLHNQRSLAEFALKSDPSDAIQRLECLSQQTDIRIGNTVDLTRWQQDLASQTSRQLKEMQTQMEKQHQALRSCLEEQFTRTRELLDAQSAHQKDLDVVRSEVRKGWAMANCESQTLLGEVTRIQKELMVDYVSVPRHLQQDSFLDQEFERSMSEFDGEVGPRTRVRDCFTQTEKHTTDDWAQTDPVKFHEEKPKKKVPVFVDSSRKSMAFAGADALKESAARESMKPPYNVFNLYHDTGIAQRIARSSVFEYTSLVVTVFNALWISIDTDLNDAVLIVDADPVFFIAENAFCVYFVVEMMIRFAAFQTKSKSLTDPWFVFDFILVVLMVIETWVVLAIMVALNITSLKGLGFVSTFRLVRLVRLVRLSRIAKLLHWVPELLIVIKALRFAARSVMVFFLMWTLIIYMFAIVFRQVTEDSAAGTKYFQSIPAAMNTLFLNGIFADQVDLVNDMSADAPWLGPMIVFFIGLVSLTTMYMLVGVLVDIVGMVAHSEKEALVVSRLASELRQEMDRMGHQHEDMSINQFELHNLLMEPSVMRIMQDVGVDVLVLADTIELAVQDVAKKEGGMSFPDVVSMILGMRGCNAATVRDCKDQVRMTKSFVKREIEGLKTDIKQELRKLKVEIENGASSSDEEDTPQPPPAGEPQALLGEEDEEQRQAASGAFGAPAVRWGTM
eukprot:TRINITY_DN23944_c0_g2_i1.p1 TRINITY_DN23944_c0_g2~~TRINITY_DN23944_c0_g2_i1.p1  ORF type:complete len:824 (+),score=187.17 TRINITY_DN23944_c0_g2_i1:123-2594(+)